MRQSPEEISRLESNAHYYKLMGQPELGLKEMELAHQQNPDNLQITDLLAQNYEELGKFEAARQLYQEAITRHGSHAVLANNLCFSYYHEGRWQEAETCFRQTLARDPGNVAARNNLGLLYCRLGRQDEARRLWQETSDAAAADGMVSQALAALGMSDRAVYARRPVPAPLAAGATQASTPKAAVSRLPASIPAEVHTPTQPVAAKNSESQVAAKTPAPTPAPVQASPEPEARQQAAVPKPAPPAARVTSAPTPGTTVAPLAAPIPAEVHTPTQPVPANNSESQVAAKTPATTSAPVEARPQPEARQQAAVPKPALAAATPGPAPQAAPQPRPAPLTSAELMGTAIEVRNGTWTKNLAHQTRSLLCQEGFTVALIGNHVDFGAATSMIYYRPGAERVARAVARTVFPGAGLAPSLKLKKGMDIKVLLGHDLLENPQFMARLNQGAPAAAPIVARPLTSPAPTYLTVAELVGTPIEVRNGTWTKNLARQTRSLLWEQGFSVALIGNHVDFGAATTIIYYRPGAERVARAVAHTVFPGAELAPSLKLKKGMDIKILLGADLLQRPQLMARLVAEGK
jgi:Flp pilus assembly protein TadD